MIRRITILILLVIGTTVLMRAQDQDSVQYENIGPEDFLTIIRFKENVILLDVRLPFEYRRERIENSVNMPLARSFKDKADKLDREALILVYCTTDVRSKRAAERLYELGFRKIYNLEGGIDAWKRKGLSVVGRKLRNRQK
jgi:rhodanese-related sulfurtransferase